MGMLVRVIEYVHSPSMEVETSGGVKFTIEELNDGLIIKGKGQLFTEHGKPGEVVVRQLEESESWTESKTIHPSF